ncbi:MAG: response regulator [Euryarchaeota archaeon]|nr:response regulator [Euryarchaeota archaeon]
MLCVDDNVDLVEVLTEMLTSLMFEPYTVLGGKECIDLLNGGSFKPDIILLDIMMSPMDGWTTLRNIRGDPRYDKIPVMMLTGKYPTMAEVNEYVTLFEGYLMKPFALGFLSSEINKVLSNVKKREEIIDDARSKGADELMLSDYRKLSSTGCLLSQFETIITDGTFTKEHFVELDERFENIVKELKEIKSIPE